MRRERGFTIIEVLVTIALFTTIGFALLGVTRIFLNASMRAGPTQGGALAIEQTADSLRSDAASAFAVFVPARDIFGDFNAAGRELDFYSKSDSGAPTFWAYYYDAATQTLRRYDYDTNGRIGEADRATGAIDAAKGYPALLGVTSFSAKTLEASALTGSTNAYAPAIAPLFGDATPQPLPVGFDDGAGSRADLYGGNTTVEVRIATVHGSRLLHLASGALPSGFTIHEIPAIRGVVYRHDTTHRFWFGLAQVSRVFINAQLLISWKNFSETNPAVWCDFNLYGNPNGLQAPFGADSAYQPTWFSETTAGIVYRVTHGQTNGARCSATPPSPGPIDGSGFFSPPPDVQDTPPPCFDAGQCWPASAPPDFSPSPAPSATPPAWWCATHAQSTLCGGRGPRIPQSDPSGLQGCVRTSACGRQL